jgi:hypothetical protein
MLDLLQQVGECYWIRFRLLRAIGMSWQKFFGVDDSYHHLPVCLECLHLWKGVTEHGNAPWNHVFLNCNSNFPVSESGKWTRVHLNFFLDFMSSLQMQKSVFRIRKQQLNALTSAG